MHSTGLLFLSNLFSGDMLIILFFVLILFGGEKLPEIARGLGKGIRDFKEASEGVKREINNQINSFEEKKSEEALNKQAETIRNQSAENANNLAEGRPPVENTMPMSDNYFGADEGSVTGDAEEVHNEPVTENHAAHHQTDDQHPVI
jgi:sec-independent protein translocase protein TatA